ncbi:DUF4270 family protein [Robertkochia solimangrovi]|uniref:DUF4270 family protein n=1 Tax=Robertkochia solimangrovi TaxID=2213046 RepID=UPI0013A5B35A|nr:DUF4270 family protein [Robertkochia solimangrovi]
MKNAIFILFGIVLLTACSPDTYDDFTAGEDFTDSSARIIYIDTFSVAVSTFKLDSLATSSATRLLAGQYQDPYFGTVRSEAYFELSPSSFDIPKQATLDSVALILGFDTYYYKDTLKLNHYNIHLIQDELTSDDNSLYNTSVFGYDATSIASIEFYPQPNFSDSLYIRIPWEVGENIFDPIRSGIVDETPDLREVFKGLTIQPTTDDDGTVLGYSKDQGDTYLRFYYTIPSEIQDESLTYDMYILDNDVSSYNKTSATRDNSFFNKLTDQDITLRSSETDSMSYVQGSTGYMTSISFPTLRNLFDLPNKGVVLNASLTIYPLIHDTEVFRDSLTVSLLNNHNEVESQLSDDFVGSVYATLLYDEEFQQYYYTLPIDGYIEDKLNETYITEDAITIHPNSFNSTVDQLIINDQGEYRPKLIVKYGIYDE